MSALQTRITARQFFELPETNTPVQLLEGQVVISPSPTLEHQTIVGNVFLLRRQAAKERGGKAFVAPLDVFLDEENVPQPDVLWLAPDSRCTVQDKRLSGAPDLPGNLAGGCGPQAPAVALFDHLEKRRRAITEQPQP
ncbi:MAG TPA: Uma2 family endonuclease [Aggregatilineales bacterium]|nr:Uma2 family endonuclease [Aggregatilineales bacterium]